MGTVRTLLALAVVLSHSLGFVLVGGQLAVQLFYLISGYLMSYILVEGRSYTDVRRFYLNRFLRLYPAYWVVALASLAMAGIWAAMGQQVPFFEVFSALDGPGRAALVAANVLIFGQDWLMFTGAQAGQLHWTVDFTRSPVEVWQGLLVPQAWTLGLELCFYVMAPFVLRRRALLLGLLLASVVVRLSLLGLGLAHRDPWSYRFFPAELSLFLFGALSHQVLKPWVLQAVHGQTVAWSRRITVLVVLCVVFFFLLPWRLAGSYLMLLLVAVSLPLLFEFQVAHDWDRRIGDYSYPIYIAHMLTIPPVVWFLSLGNWAGAERLLKPLLVVVLTLVISHLIEHQVSARIERLRQVVKGRGASRPHSAESAGQRAGTLTI